MLQTVDVSNLTVFSKSSFQFSPQLNLLIGENGTGKSHLLKVLYSVLAASADEGRRIRSATPTRNALQVRLSEKLVNVLRPESLGSLVRRKASRERCSLHFGFDDFLLNIDFSFTSGTNSVLAVDRLPNGWLERPPVFLPTRELLSIYPGFVSTYETVHLEFEETWRDTCALLGAPALRESKEPRVKELLQPLERAMGGTVELDSAGRFYLVTPTRGRVEMHLVAEGWRKLAMLAQLIATGALLDRGYLFWDEPETNLNPKLIKQIAPSILHLAQNGIQVFIATHSLFLMRELTIQMENRQYEGLRARFFGLQLGRQSVAVEQGDSIDDIGAIAALDEELQQSDRYLATEAKSDANHH